MENRSISCTFKTYASLTPWAGGWGGRLPKEAQLQWIIIYEYLSKPNPDFDLTLAHRLCTFPAGICQQCCGSGVWPWPLLWPPLTLHGPGFAFLSLLYWPPTLSLGLVLPSQHWPLIRVGTGRGRGQRSCLSKQKIERSIDNIPEAWERDLRALWWECLGGTWYST